MFKDIYTQSIGKHNPSDALIERTRAAMLSPPKRRNKVVWKYAINISAACLLIVAVTVAYQLIPNNIEFQNSNDQIISAAGQSPAAAPTGEASPPAGLLSSSTVAQKQLEGSAGIAGILVDGLTLEDAVVPYSAPFSDQGATSAFKAIINPPSSYYVNEIANVVFPVKSISSDYTVVRGYELTEELIIEKFGDSFGFYIPDYMTLQLPFSYEVTETNGGEEILRCYSFAYSDMSSTKAVNIRAYPTNFPLSDTVTTMLNPESEYQGSIIDDVEVYLGVGIDNITSGYIQMAEFVSGGMLYQIVSSDVAGDDFVKTLCTLIQSSKFLIN